MLIFNYKRAQVLNNRTLSHHQYSIVRSFYNSCLQVSLVELLVRLCIGSLHFNTILTLWVAPNQLDHEQPERRLKITL